MPPEYSDPKEFPRPSEEDLQGFEAWIKAGAKFPREDKRPFIERKTVLLTIRNYLRDKLEGDAQFLRFLTLEHLHNNPNVEDYQLRLTRAAPSKLLNSLTWQNTIVRPQAIDENQTIFVIDLRLYRWEQNPVWMNF